MFEQVNTRAVPATRCADRYRCVIYFILLESLPGSFQNRATTAKSVWSSVECASFHHCSLKATKYHVCRRTKVRALAEIIRRIRITYGSSCIVLRVVTSVSGAVRRFGVNFGVTAASSNLDYDTLLYSSLLKCHKRNYE